VTERQAYVQAVLRYYLQLPGTPPRARPQDRRLAEQLHDQATPLSLVETALLLATARRTRRPSHAPPLGPIRSLHYFAPVIEELQQEPPRDGYLDYLRDALGRPTEPDPQTGVGPKTTLPRDRQQAARVRVL